MPLCDFVFILMHKGSCAKQILQTSSCVHSIKFQSFWVFCWLHQWVWGMTGNRAAPFLIDCSFCLLGKGHACCSVRWASLVTAALYQVTLMMAQCEWSHWCIYLANYIWDRCFMGSCWHYVSGFSKISKEIGTLLMSSEVFATVCLHRISAIPSPDQMRTSPLTVQLGCCNWQ